MFKKIIIFSILIFVIGISSCSMWDDVDMNTPFEIPVDDNIYVTSIPNQAQWIYIPVFLQNDISKNSVSEYSINTVKIATNSDKTKLFFQVVVNGTLPMVMGTYFVFLISNDYSCDGYFIHSDYYMAMVNMYNICNNTSTLPLSFIISNGANNNSFEISINTSSFPKLDNKFLISIFSTTSTGGPGTVNPANYSGSSTKARWVKLR